MMRAWNSAAEMPGPMPRTSQRALKTELAKRGFESMSIKRELPGGRIEVEANKLHPVHVEAGEPIFAPVPVSVSVALDPRGRVKSIDGDTPHPAAFAHAPRYINCLRDRGSDAAPRAPESTPGHTRRSRRCSRGPPVL